MNGSSAPSPRYAGAVIVLALLLGGGTSQGLWTDHLIELAMMPALFLGLAGFMSNRLDASARWLVILFFVILTLQFFPVWRTIPLLGKSAFGLWSPAPQKSLEAALFTCSALGFFLYVALMSDRDRARCIPYFYVGLFINSAIAIVQLSYGRSATISGVVPFDMTMGLFANENHFSSLFFALIPLAAYSLIARRSSTLYFAVLCLVLITILFAVGSRAGMGISTAIAVISLIWFMPTIKRMSARLLAVTVGGLCVIGSIAVFGSGSSIEGDLRWTMFATTVESIRDHWLSGSGLGTFTLVYPGHEDVGQVLRTYANHAHNDFLELVLETGIPGLLMMIVYFVLLGRGAVRSQQSEAAFLSILAVSLHSLIDYPLRTFALATTFAFMSALVLTRPEPRPDAAISKQKRRVRRPGRSTVIEHGPAHKRTG